MAVRFFALKTKSSWYLLMHRGFLKQEWFIVDPDGNRHEIHAYLVSAPSRDLRAINENSRPVAGVRMARDFLHRWLVFSVGRTGENSLVGYTSQVEEVFSVTGEWHYIVRRLNATQTIRFFRLLLEKRLIPDDDLRGWQQMLLKERRLMEVPATGESMHDFFLRAYGKMLLDEDFIQDFLYNLFMNKPHLMERLGEAELAHIDIVFADPRKSRVERVA